MLIETLLPKEVEQHIVQRADGRVQVLDSGEMMGISRNIIDKYEVSETLRREVLIPAFASDDSFEQLAHEMCVRFFPIAYLEAFGELYHKAQDITKNWKIRKL
jgi:hypothetical protein